MVYDFIIYSRSWFASSTLTHSSFLPSPLCPFIYRWWIITSTLFMQKLCKHLISAFQWLRISCVGAWQRRLSFCSSALSPITFQSVGVHVWFSLNQWNSKRTDNPPSPVLSCFYTGWCEQETQSDKHWMQFETTSDETTAPVASVQVLCWNSSWVKSVRAVTEAVGCLCSQVWRLRACTGSVGTRRTRTTSRNSLIKVTHSDTHTHIAEPQKYSFIETWTTSTCVTGVSKRHRSWL